MKKFEVWYKNINEYCKCEIVEADVVVTETTSKKYSAASFYIGRPVVENLTAFFSNVSTIELMKEGDKK